MATETKADLEARIAELESEKQVPHVYQAISKILRTLSVEKNGVLPGNMGGKPYISAVDLAAEAKRLFVANDLIALPNETVTKHEVINDNGRKSIFIGIEALYTLVSTVDGSMVTAQGVGDGIANGSAVASNIASTNAMKNAFLRLFLVTEQSVEDQAKEPREEKAAPQAVAKARQPQAPKPPASSDLKARIKAEFIDNDDSPYDSASVNALWADTTKAVGKPKGSDEVMSKLLERLEAGETA